MDDPIDCVDVAAWEAWLEAHHADVPNVWVRIAKKGSGLASITAAEGTAGALCFGWIDGHRKGLDETHFLQRYSPRTRKSSWSAINVQLAEQLIAAGRMRRAGFAEIEKAKADGRWDAAYASQGTATLPPELEQTLAAAPHAAAAFAALGRSDRYTLILPVLKASTPATRQKQIDRVIAALTNP